MNADLFLVFDKTQYMPGDTLNADVFIGSSTHTQSNFYGAAFSLSYDPSFVQPGTEKFWFNNSWVGNINQQKIKFRRLNTTTGNVAASLVRITHTDTSGFGKVARLQFVIKNPIADTMLHFTISNVVKTNAAGMQTSLTGGVDSVSVINQGTNIYSGTGTKIALYPNPAKHTVTVNGLLPQQDIRIYSLLGNEVLRTVAIGGRNTIDLSSLPAGIYILQAGAERIRFVKE